VLHSSQDPAPSVAERGLEIQSMFRTGLLQSSTVDLSQFGNAGF
jgi:hypothetical protein